MSFLYNWWYATPQQSTDNSGVGAGAACDVSARLYLNELKTKLREEFRAESAERCTDAENVEQNKVIERRRKAVSSILEKTQVEIEACTNNSDLLRLEARQKRLREDFLV